MVKVYSTNKDGYFGTDVLGKQCNISLDVVNINDNSFTLTLVDKEYFTSIFLTNNDVRSLANALLEAVSD